MRRQIIISLKCLVTFFMVAWWSNIQANPCFIGENASDTIAQPVAIPDTAAGVGEVFYVVEEMPDFIYKDKHGIFAFHNYVQMQIKYPETEYEPGIQGKVHVSFIVEADGRISTIRIKRSLYKSIDEGVIDIIAHAPRWIPGKQKGSPVRVTFTIPVTFKLQ